MGLEVIGAGFGRTGTLSLKLALEQLGYSKCHHMVEIFRSAGQARLWKAIADGGKPDWDTVFDGFRSSVDFPSCVFYRELAETYPDAKVILTVRPADSWFKSASETIFAASFDNKAMPRWLPKLVPHIGRIFAMHDKLLWQGVFGGRKHDPEHAKAIYERHNAEVEATIPANRLLVFEVKQGWAPLCAFLGKPVPDSPFPNVNDTAEFRKRIQTLKIVRWVPWALGAALIAALVWFVTH